MALAESVLQCGLSGIVFATTWTKNQSDYLEDNFDVIGGSGVDSSWNKPVSMFQNNKTLPRNRLMRFYANHFPV